MMIMSERFGVIETTNEESIRFPDGIAGFPNERDFVLVRHGRSSALAWLQSKNNPALALPVVSAHGFGEVYPDVSIEEPARKAGIYQDGQELAVMVVLSAPKHGPATVNLLAPIIVNVTTRIGAQLILDGTRFSTRELFVMPEEREAETAPAPPMYEDENLAEAMTAE
jgi:flagellar assembly factor FliW